MRILLQRVNSASVKIADSIVGEIKEGLLCFVGISADDESEDIDYIVNKTLGLRIFNNKDGKFDFSIKDVCGELLIVSQFTLYANTQKGKRPSFKNAMPPIEASILFEEVVQKFRSSGLKVETGQFQEEMEVSLVNHGPVTLMIDSRN